MLKFVKKCKKMLKIVKNSEKLLKNVKKASKIENLIFVKNPLFIG